MAVLALAALLLGTLAAPGAAQIVRTHAADRPGAAALAVDSAGRPEPVAAAGRGAEEAWLDELGALWARMPGKGGQASPELLQALKTVAKLALHPAPEPGAPAAAREILEDQEAEGLDPAWLEMLEEASNEARGVLQGLYQSSQGNDELIKAIKEIAKFALGKMGLCGGAEPEGVKGLIAKVVCGLVAEPGEARDDGDAPAEALNLDQEEVWEDEQGSWWLVRRRRRRRSGGKLKYARKCPPGDTEVFSDHQPRWEYSSCACRGFKFWSCGPDMAKHIRSCQKSGNMVYNMASKCQKIPKGKSPRD